MTSFYGGLNGGLNDGLNSWIIIIKNNPGIKAKEASVLLNNRSVNTIEKQIKELLRKGLIERKGGKKTLENIKHEKGDITVWKIFQ